MFRIVLVAVSIISLARSAHAWDIPSSPVVSRAVKHIPDQPHSLRYLHVQCGDVRADVRGKRASFVVQCSLVQVDVAEADDACRLGHIKTYGPLIFRHEQNTGRWIWRQELPSATCAHIVTFTLLPNGGSFRLHTQATGDDCKPHVAKWRSVTDQAMVLTCSTFGGS